MDWSSSLEAALKYDYTHPERHYKGLILATEKESFEIHKQRFKDGILTDCRPNQELCRSCGWSTDLEFLSSYGSRVKIMHARDNMGWWAIGSEWILRDQPNDATIGGDYMTQQFLRAQPGLEIPLAKEMRLLSDPMDKIHFTLMSRPPGVTLQSIWGILTPRQKLGYKDQLANCIRQLRKFTAPIAQRVDGSDVGDFIIAFCQRRWAPTCKKIGHTTEEWFESIAEELRRGLSRIHKTEDPTIIETKLQELKDNFPKSEPYVLTHADLTLSNIIVKNDKIEAIIDWEMSGYYPWWAERWLSLLKSDRESADLFDSLWADLSPEMDEDTFAKEIFEKLMPVHSAWKMASEDIYHPGKNTELLRPGFCKCKPYAGCFKSLAIGQLYEHKLREKNPPPP
jgi:hypothetical protein